MKLGELLEQIKLGTEEFKKQEVEKQFLESYDEDTEDYKVSVLLGRLIGALSEDIDEITGPVIRSLRKSTEKIKMYETKIEDNGSVSEAYTRMKLDSLKEEYNHMADLLSKNKVRQAFDKKEALANAVALVKFQMETLADDIQIEVKGLKALNESFATLVNKEYKIIEESIYG